MANPNDLIPVGGGLAIPKFSRVRCFTCRGRIRPNDNYCITEINLPKGKFSVFNHSAEKPGQFVNDLCYGKFLKACISGDGTPIPGEFRGPVYHLLMGRYVRTGTITLQ